MNMDCRLFTNCSDAAESNHTSTVSVHTTAVSVHTTAAINNDTSEYDDDEDARYDDFLRNSRFVIQRVLIPIICVLGIICNSLTILVFSQRRLRSSTNIYLRALAAFDLLYLASVFILSFQHNVRSRYLFYYLPYGFFITDFASNTSVWLTAAFTIERFFVVANPMKNLKYASAPFAQRIVLMIAAACFTCTLSTAFEQRVLHVFNNQTNVTDLRLEPTALGQNEAYTNFISIFTAVVFVLIPFVAIATLNVFLIRSIRRARNVRSHLMRPDSVVTSEVRTTLILVSVVVMFLICQAPSASIMITNVLIVRLDGKLYRGLNNIFNLLVAINACSNFFLYVGLSAKFRRTFLGLLFSRVNSKLFPRSLRDHLYRRSQRSTNNYRGDRGGGGGGGGEREGMNGGGGQGMYYHQQQSPHVGRGVVQGPNGCHRTYAL